MYNCDKTKYVTHIKGTHFLSCLIYFDETFIGIILPISERKTVCSLSITNAHAVSATLLSLEYQHFDLFSLSFFSKLTRIWYTEPNAENVRRYYGIHVDASFFTNYVTN